MSSDWKLKLRYGKISTPFSHYTILAEGVVDTLQDGFECPKGSAFMAMKSWATNTAEAADVLRYVSSQIGFHINDEIQVFETEPEEPPREKPFGYDINFTPF